MDAGTALGALKQHNAYQSPVNAVIGPWDHGGERDAGPYVNDERFREVDENEQLIACLQFFDAYLKTAAPAGQKYPITYYTMGENKWKQTQQWPPRGVSMVNYYFNADSTLSKTSSDNAQIDTYSRDLRAGTGWTNRWWTQIGRPVHYKDRKKDQEYLLTYTTPKLTAPTEITGHPILTPCTYSPCPS